jgi:hypothetical protein
MSLARVDGRLRFPSGTPEATLLQPDGYHLVRDLRRVFTAGQSITPQRYFARRLERDERSHPGFPVLRRGCRPRDPFCGNPFGEMEDVLGAERVR